MLGQRRRSSVKEKAKVGQRRWSSPKDRKQDIGGNGSAQMGRSGDSAEGATGSSRLSLEHSLKSSTSTCLFESSSVVSRHAERVGRICSKCYYVLCKSKGFWNIFPWVVALTLLFSSSFYTVCRRLAMAHISSPTAATHNWRGLTSVIVPTARCGCCS